MDESSYIVIIANDWEHVCTFRQSELGSIYKCLDETLMKRKSLPASGTLWSYLVIHAPSKGPLGFGDNSATAKRSFEQLRKLSSRLQFSATKTERLRASPAQFSPLEKRNGFFGGSSFRNFGSFFSA